MIAARSLAVASGFARLDDSMPKSSTAAVTNDARGNPGNTHRDAAAAE